MLPMMGMMMGVPTAPLAPLSATPATAGQPGKYPIFSTGFIRSPISTDSEISLPDFLCMDGVCKGTMPGCTKANPANTAPIKIPFLVMHQSRQFKFSDKGAGAKMFKTMMAYAFSTLPEVVEVVIESLNKSATTTLYPPISTTQAMAWGVPGSVTAAPVASVTPPAPIIPGSQPTPLPIGAAGQNAGWSNAAPAAAANVPQAPNPFEQASQFFANVFNPPATTAAPIVAPVLPPAPVVVPSRRLRSTDDSAETDDDMSGEWHDTKVSVRLKGLPFTVDRPMIDMMMRHNMFQEVDDDLTRESGAPPLTITSYEIYSGGDVGAEDDSSEASMPRPWSLQYVRPKAPARSARSLLGFASVAGAAVITAVAAGMLAYSKVAQQR